MGILYIAEFSEMPITDNAVGHSWAMTPPLVEQKITYSTTTASAAFNVKTTFVRLHTDSICSVAFVASGGTPTATTSNMRMAASTTEYFGVQGGGALAAITNT